jgi:5-dehydro-2-deoxygluconokinase
MDLYPDPDGTKIAEADRFVSDVGGAGGNIAVALARQGIKVALINPLSNDAVGRFVRAKLVTYQVDVSRCRVVEGEFRTSLAFAETRTDNCEVVIYRNAAADLQLSETDIAPPFVASASVLIVTGTALAAAPSRAAVAKALTTARSAKTFTVLDIDHRPYSWASGHEAATLYSQAASQCDAVIGNDDEFGLIAGERDGALAAAERFVTNGSAFAILKKGANGSTTVTPAGQFETGVFPVTAMKPFGAGDAFIGGLIAALLRGYPLETAVTRASGSAAHVVSRRGCASAMPTTVEIETIISSHSLSARTGDAHSAT